MDARNNVRLGVIGCGGFGLFAMQHFVQVPGVKLVAIAGTHREAAIAAGKRFGVPDIEAVDSLLRRDDIDLVYIATPPFLHYPQAMAALQAGKHVICEKPIALTVEQADELCTLARSRDLLFVVNLMQRYNPLAETVRKLIDSQVLGEVLHGFFENYASDEGLRPEHWFWDRDKSGGIFIEHGVHFFDLFEGWLGKGEVIAAQRMVRPGTLIEDQVQCTVRYGPSTLVNFYHGFHQPGRLDRQEFRLLFERGEVSLFEWVPTRIRVHAIVDETATRTLTELFPDTRLRVSQTYAGQGRACQGRHKALDVSQLIEIHSTAESPKMHLYGDLLTEMISDQTAWIRDRAHPRRITDRNGRDSLAMAVAADRLARR